MDPNRMDISEDGFSTAGGGRSLRDTKARQNTKENQQAKLIEKRDQLKELEKIEKEDRSTAQLKKITKLRKELGIDETSESVDPQSKPQYPESASGDNEEGKSEKFAQKPGSGNTPSSEDETVASGNRKGKGSSGNQSTITPETTEGGVAVAYCRCKSFGKLRKIYRFGPRGHSKLEFGPSKAYTKDEIAGLPQISGAHKTIFDIQEAGRWLYGFNNIREVVSVATLTPNPHRKWKPRMTKKGKAIHVFPTILVGILWDKIQPRHQELLQDGESFIFRGKLMERLIKKDKLSLDDWIQKAANRQDLSYKNWLREKGITNRERPPTFFPGVDWANAPARTKKSTSQHAQTKSNSSNSGSQANGSPREDNHPSSRKRQRANSGANSESMKKPRPASASTEESTKTIDYRSYLSYNMNHFKLTDKMRDDDPEEYQEILDMIEKDWNNYRRIMIKQGYTVVPGGEKPEA